MERSPWSSTTKRSHDRALALLALVSALLAALGATRMFVTRSWRLSPTLPIVVVRPAVHNDPSPTTPEARAIVRTPSPEPSQHAPVPPEPVHSRLIEQQVDGEPPDPIDDHHNWEQETLPPPDED